MINEHIKKMKPKMGSIPNSDNAIRLNLGELAYPPSPHVIKAITEAAPTMYRYPDAKGDPLREALTAYTGRKKEQIFIGNGSDDLIELLVKVFAGYGTEVIIPIPTFFMYRHVTQIMNGKPVFVNRTANFELDTAAILQKAESPQARMIFIANPNNPTGNLVSQESIIEVVSNTDRIVVVDECYYEMCQETAIELTDRYENLIILRSFSKSFGIAGLRIGYGITTPYLVDYIYRAALSYPINRMAHVAALAALEDIDYARKKIEEILQEKEKVARNLSELGFFIHPSVTNFLLLHTEPLGITSKELTQALQTKNILVADFGLKPGFDAYCLRISIGTPDSNKALLAGLKEIITHR